MSNHVVDAIDNALYDWETSADAMRWAPDAPRVPQVQPPQITLTVDTAPFVEAMCRIAEAAAEVAKKVAPVMRRIGADFARQQERAAMRRHQPIPLSIDGHEYHRRRKGRRR